MQSTQEVIRRWFVLLVSPATISLVVSVVISLATDLTIARWMWICLSVAAAVWIVFYLTAYEKSFSRVIHGIASLRRRRRFRKPRVLILDGRLDRQGVADAKPLYTNRRPDDWVRALRKANPKWTIELGSVLDVITTRPDIVLNPFGEVYPEEDLSLHTTLTKIRDYVSCGGVYVNVAGYPFWWQYNPVTRVKAQSGRWEQQSPNRMVLKPLLADSLLAISPVIPGEAEVVASKQEKVDRDRFGEIAGAGGTENVKMFRQYPMTVQQMVPLLRTADNKFIVIGAVPYGAGHFIFAGVEIDNTSTAFEKVVAAVGGWVKYERTG
jgi:hypothetical protein